MNITLGGDHAGFDYKKELIDFLKANGHDTTDVGPFSTDSVDYPDFAHPLAEAVETKESDFGVLVCGSGNGVAITANKHQGIRAALCWSEEIAKLSREHNDANVICIPARFVSVDEAKQMVDAFINTAFEGGRHSNRVNKISCA